ncbi:MAG: tyrosine-type recombinase/integrase [Deltaproteobacteria bacterium]|jgi:integrase
MPRRIAPLTDTQIRNAKPQAKDYKLFDGGGLFLLVTPTWGKLWRLKYRFGGREKLLSFGAYPQISLSAARQKREEAKGQVANGIDPGEAKKEEAMATETFEELAREWLTKQETAWTPRHKETVQARLETYVYPHLGARPVAEITAPELLGVLRKIEAKGTFETAHRVKQICGQVFRYGVGKGVCEHDPSAGLRGQLAAKPKPKHMAAITDPKETAGLLRAIDGYSGTLIIKCALRLAPLVFVRPGELRHMEWKEIDFDAALWTIPAEKMKMRKTHAVPLSRQTLAILEEIRLLTGEGRYVFPSARTTARPISNMAINAALRRMGFTKEEMTGHGFRSTASSLLHEAGWDSNLIELQLAHRDTNTVRAIYNRAERLEERRKMMQQWADYLDALKSGAKIVPFRAAG